MYSCPVSCLSFRSLLFSSLFFFFNDTATTEIYTLSLHDALPIFVSPPCESSPSPAGTPGACRPLCPPPQVLVRSEEHTFELQSQSNLVCRLLLEKKKKTKHTKTKTKQTHNMTSTPHISPCYNITF